MSVMATGLFRTLDGRWRTAVLVLALATTLLKLMFAATTFGTNDAHSWIDFAQGVEQFGLTGVYGKEYFTQYNHPPLAGIMLVVINWLVDLGVAGVPFLIRVPASIADLGSALLVFEIARHYRPVWQAGVGGILVALSPALVVISGFHANTDPLFVFFVLLAVWCTQRGWGWAAGVAIALAISVKLVPVVVLPVLLVALFGAHWRRGVAFLLGGLTVVVPLWGPVLLLAWPEFNANVLGYNGVTLREWGLPQFLTWWDAPEEFSNWLIGPGRFAVLALSALVPAALVWWRPAALAPAAGLSLALFLLVTPAFGMQYVVWPLAAAFLMSIAAGALYNVAASAYILTVYANWNGIGAGASGPLPPWSWFEGVAVEARPQDLALMVFTWCALALVVLAGLLSSVRAGRPHSTQPPLSAAPSDPPREPGRRVAAVADHP